MAKPDFQLKWGVDRVGGIPVTDPADYKLGWQYRAGLPPLTGNFDYYQNLADQRLLYINAQGIPEWDAMTAYDTNAYVKGSDGKLYRSTAPTTGNDPIAGGPWTDAVIDYLNSARINIASATNVDLTANAPNTRHIVITGTTKIDSFTVTSGNCYFVTFDASLILSNNANITTRRGADINVEPGDTCVIRCTSNNVVEVILYTRARGAIGDGQTWQDVTGIRSNGVTYTNTTGKAIGVSISVGISGITSTFTINGALSQSISSNASTGTGTQWFFIIQDGDTYELVTGTINSWAELR